MVNVGVRQGSEASQKFLQYLSGEKYVEVTPGDPNRPAIPEGELLPSAKGSRLFEQSEDIADNLNAITISLKGILEPLQKGEGLLGEIIQNPEFGKEGMAKIEATVDNIREISQSIRDGRGVVGRLLSDDELAARLDDLGVAVKQMSSLLEAIGRGEGAMGSLTKKGGDAEIAIADIREAAASLRRVTARLESKKEHVANLRDGKPHYRGIAPRERTVRVTGDVGIVTGVSDMHVERDGKDNRFTVRYLAVYTKTGPDWKMTAWQSTRVPDS